MTFLLFLALCALASGQGDLCGTNTTTVPAADVSVNIAGPALMTIGNPESYSYQLNVANAGPNTSFAIILSDLMPCSLRVIRVAPAEGFGTSCTFSARTDCPPGQLNNVTCSIPFMAGATSTNVIVNVTVPSDAQPVDELVNTARVSAATCDNDLTNNVNSAVSRLTPAANLAVTIIGDATGTAGQVEVVRQEVQTVNLGTSDVTDAFSLFEIPSEVNFAGVEDLNGNDLSCAVRGSSPCCRLSSSNSSILNCTIGAMAAGGSFQYRVEMRLPSDACVGQGGCSLTFIARVASSTFDPNLNNNVAQNILIINIDSNVGVTKSGPSGVVAGQATQSNPEFYTIVVENAGPSDARNVQMRDFFPNNIVPYDGLVASCTQGTGGGPCVITCSYSTATDPSFSRFLLCSIPELKVEGKASIVVPFSVPSFVMPGTVIMNTAFVVSETTDSDDARNQDPHEFPVVGRADPYVTKSGPQGVIIADTNEEYRYEFTVGNLNVSDARQVVVFDTLDAKLELLSVNDTRCAVSLNTFTCNFGTVTPGQIIAFHARFRVRPGFNGIQAVVPNCIQLTSDTVTTPDVNLNNNQACTQFTLFQAPDVGVTKTGPAQITLGTATQQYFYTIVVTNLGPIATASNVQMVDTIPNFPSFTVPANAVVRPETLVNPDGVARTFPLCSIAVNTVTCQIGTMVNGLSVRIIIPFDVAPNTMTGQYDNTAVVSHTTPDTNSTNDRDTFPTIVVRIADLQITKIAPVEEVCAGDGFHFFTILVQNLGPADAQGTVVSDTFNSVFDLNPFTFDATGAAVQCNLAGQTVTCNVQGPPINVIVRILIRFRVPSSVRTTTVLNNATVVSFYDPNPSNDWSAINQFICNRAPLTIDKSVSSSTVTAGAADILTYTLTGRNNGPSDAVDAVLEDVLPAQWNIVSTQSGCTYTAATRLLRCTYPSLLAGQSVSAQVLFTVPANTLPGTVENCVDFWSATAPNTVNSKVRDCVNVTVSTLADVRINKSGPACPIAGSTVVSQYVVTVDNLNGPSRATNVVVTDSLPPGLTAAGNASITGAETGASCSVSGGQYICNLGGLNRGVVVSITIPFTVPSSTVPPQQVTNTAVVQWSNGAVATRTATYSHAICNSVDLKIVKEGPAQVSSGSNTIYQYTLTASNVGLSDALNARVTDDIPLDFVVVGEPTPSPACRYESINTATSTTRLVCDFARFNVGQVQTIVIRFTVGANVASGIRENCVAISSSSSQGADTNPSDNTDCVETLVNVLADLSILKFGPEEICAGSSGAFQLIVSNGGPATAFSVTVVDNLPVQFTPGTVSLNPQNSSGASCQFVGRQLFCDLKTMVPNTVYIIGYTVSVLPSVLPVAKPPGVTNTATVTSTTSDGTQSNNQASWSTAICARSTFVTRKFAPATVVAGRGSYLYTLEVTNNGPADARQVVLSDTLPINFVGQSVVSDGSADSCSFDATGKILTCAWLSATFPAGASTQIVFSFTVTSDANIGQRVNCFEVSSPTSDPVSACATTLVTTLADLSIVKTGPNEICAGAPEGTFTLTVRNAQGPSVARGVVVTDELPSGLNPSTAIPTVDGVARGDLCRYTDRRFSCNLPDMAPGVTHVITFQFGVAASEAARTVRNTAFVSAATQDDRSDNNSSFQDVLIRNCADYTIAKTAPTEPVEAGNPTLQVFTLTARNFGPSDARNVVVTDQSLSAINVEIVAVSGANCEIISLLPGSNANAVRCTIALLPAGQSQIIQIFWRAPASANPGQYENCAIIESSTPKVGTGPVAVCVPFTINASARLVVVKSGVTPIFAGQNLPNQQFFITVQNTGGSDARDVTFSDDVNSIFTVTSVTPSVGSCNQPVSNSVRCSFGTIAPNGIVTITIRYTTLPSAPLGFVPNTACVATSTAQNDTSRNCGSFDTEVRCLAPLSTDKTVDISSIEAGSGVVGTFTIKVTNNGPSASTSTLITDTWPSALTRVGAPSITVGGPCTETTTGFICNVGTLQPNQTVMVTQQFTAASAETATSAINLACAGNSCSSQQYCGSAIVGITQRSELCITKTNGVDVVEAGKQYVYTITVTNKGPSDAPGLTLLDTWPSVLTIDEVIAPAGWFCSSSANSIFCSRSSPLVALGVDTFFVRYTVPALLDPGFVTNCVEVFFSGRENDKSDNRACDTDRVINFADLEITKTINNEVCPVAGSNDLRTYIVTVTNKGPSRARNVRVFERFPQNLTLVSYDTTRCTLVEGGILCLLGTMEPNAQIILSFSFVVPACTPAGIVENHVNVTSDTPDPDLCNNEAHLCTPICVESDLEITKDDNVMEVTAGDDVVYTYTICARNIGPSCAAEVEINDKWPFAQWGSRGTISAPAGWSCVWSSDNNFRCFLAGGLTPANGRQCATVTYTVPACLEACEVCNSVSISSPSSPDPNGANNHATDCNKVRTEADLYICKSDGVTSVVAGDNIVYTYTIDVCNKGPSCAKDVRVLDHFPCDVTRQGVAVPSQGSCINTDDCNDFSCNLVTLQPDQCVNITASYKVPAGASTCSITNVAVVSSVTFDPEVCNNDAHDVNALLENATLAITKTGPLTLDNFNRNPQTYVITVTNLGVSTAREVHVTDRWPAELLPFLDRTTGSAITATRGARCVTTGGDFSCAVGDLGVGESVFITARFTLKAHIPCGTVISNRATAFSPTDSECREATANTTVTCLSPTERCINCVQFHAQNPNGQCYAAAEQCRTGANGAACASCINSIIADPINPPTQCFSDSSACRLMQCIYNDACGLGAPLSQELRECDSPFTDPITCPGDNTRRSVGGPVNAPAVFGKITPEKKNEVALGTVLPPQKVNVDAKLSSSFLTLKFKNELKMKVQMEEVSLQLETATGKRHISLSQVSAAVVRTTCKSSMKLRKDWTWTCEVILSAAMAEEIAHAPGAKVVANGKAVVRDGYHPVVGVSILHSNKK